MKKLNLSFLAAIAVIALFSGCSGLNKMKKSASGIKYEVKPEVLEMNGGIVGLTLEATYPKKFFNKKAIVVATPVLKTPSGEVDIFAKNFNKDIVNLISLKTITAICHYIQLTRSRTGILCLLASFPEVNGIIVTPFRNVTDNVHATYRSFSLNIDLQSF